MIILPAPCIIYCMLNGHTAVAIRASAVATQEATDEDRNWLRGSTFKEIAVAIRKARWLANDWRKARRLANDCRSGGTTGAPNA